MKAMILAAGLGTRLKPLTDTIPKALVKVGEKTLLELTIERLELFGFDEIVVNVHHFSEQVIDFLRSRNFRSHIYISDESRKLLDTGGGILFAQKYLEGKEPFLVHNVDILSDIDLKNLYGEHLNSNSLATIAVSHREASRFFLFDENMKLAGWRNTLTGKSIIPNDEKTLNPFAFSGIHVISPLFFDAVNMKGAFSIVDAYLRLCSNYAIKGIEFSNNTILDVGKPENLLKAEELVGRKSK